MKPSPGTLLGDRYVLLAEIGEAPGHVEYRARDNEVEVEVALWWIRPELFPDPSPLLGAGVELRAIHDPAVRRCFGAGVGRGGLWVTWQPAARWRPSASPAPTTELRHWIDAVGRALAALHAAGVVHGRLTPDDLVVAGGAFKLGGGGVWRDVDPAAATRAWARWEHYLAPEVRRHQLATEASDVWSVAMIALEMVAGVPGGSPDAARVATLRHPQLGAVLGPALAADPARRPPLAYLVDAIRHAAEYPYGPPAAHLPPTPATPAGPFGPSLPTPARKAIDHAVEKARTAPPGEFRVQAVSLKPGPPVTAPLRVPPPPPVAAPPPDAPTGETPPVVKPVIRSLAEVAPRSLSLPPGQLGYLAPPKQVTDGKKQARTRALLVLALMILVGGGVGVALALML